MTPYKGIIRSILSVVVSAAILLAVLRGRPLADDPIWTVLVAVVAALGLHVLRLASSLFIGRREPHGH